MIPSEKLERFILGFGLQIRDERFGRPTTLTALWLAAKDECGDRDMNELLDAIHNLSTGHVRFWKFIPNSTLPPISFERFRNNTRWKDFFNESFNVQTLPEGRKRFEKLSETTTDDHTFACLAIDEARKSISEQDGKPRPKVGAVVVKDGKVLSTAHRGEHPANHAEYIALEKKLSDEAVAGATVYTTLEPCTTRNHPKIPCADRLAERKVRRVVIGMLDPNPDITGRGVLKLRTAGIITELFPHDLMAEVEELNREFTRFCVRRSSEAQEETLQTTSAQLGLVKTDHSISQNINSPIFNVNISQPATTQPQQGPAGVAPPEPQQRVLLPNIVVTGVHVVGVAQSVYGVWTEHIPLEDAFIVQFTNEAKMNRQNVGGPVTAQIIYRDRTRELRRITGCWLNQAADFTEFRVDETQSLMLGLMLSRRFMTVAKRRVGVEVDLYSGRFGMDVIPLAVFKRGTVCVRLTHANNGDVLYEGYFQLNTRPLEIIRL